MDPPTSDRLVHQAVHLVQQLARDDLRSTIMLQAYQLTRSRVIALEVPLTATRMDSIILAALLEPLLLHTTSSPYQSMPPLCLLMLCLIRMVQSHPNYHLPTTMSQSHQAMQDPSIHRMPIDLIPAQCPNQLLSCRAFP